MKLTNEFLKSIGFKSEKINDGRMRHFLSISDTDSVLCITEKGNNYEESLYVKKNGKNYYHQSDFKFPETIEELFKILMTVSVICGQDAERDIIVKNLTDYYNKKN